VTVAVPAHLANVPRAPMRSAANARNPGVRGRVAAPRLSNTAKPAMQKVAYNAAPAKNKRR
ncbi:MAG TPA: hypothetical protein VK663_13365, partial [Burkholderiales bacterium]|nr:hypothetical protein [Burkholderiales bacterium]